MAGGTSAGRAQGRANAASFGGGGIGGFTFIMDNAAVQRLLTSKNGPVGKELVRRVLMIARAAKSGCPVDTGRLRSSITWRLAVDGRGLAGIVGTNVEYAPPIEFGHKLPNGKRTTAQPFLRNALKAKSGGSGTILT